MHIIYSKYFNKTISFFAIISALLLGTKTGMRIFDICNNPAYYAALSTIKLLKYYDIIIENIIFTGIFIFLFFRPQKFILIGLIALWYSVNNLLSSNSVSYMGIPMYILGIATFTIRGFFLKKAKLKISIFVGIYIICLFVPVFYAPDFVKKLINEIAISIVLFIAVFFIAEYAKQIGLKQSLSHKVLNIASYDGLDRSDMYLLQDVLDNKKYKEIAQEIHGSEGALRNKLSKIYKILEVGDRTGFLTIYSGYKIVYEPD